MTDNSKLLHSVEIKSLRLFQDPSGQEMISAIVNITLPNSCNSKEEGPVIEVLTSAAISTDSPFQDAERAVLDRVAVDLRSLGDLQGRDLMLSYRGTLAKFAPYRG